MKTIISLSAKALAPSGDKLAKELMEKRSKLAGELAAIDKQLSKMTKDAESAKTSELTTIVKSLGYKTSKAINGVSITNTGVPKKGSFHSLYIQRGTPDGIRRLPPDTQGVWYVVVDKKILVVVKAENMRGHPNPNAGKLVADHEPGKWWRITRLSEATVSKALESAINYAKKLSEKEPSKPSAAGPALRRNNGIRR